MAFFTVVQLSRWPRISPFFHLAQFSPAALHPIPKAAPTPFWENFLPALTHLAGCPSFYNLLLFVLVFAGLVYGGARLPRLLLFSYGYQNGHPSLSGVTRACPVGRRMSNRPG